MNDIWSPILVDTSVWIDHFRMGLEGLTKLLDRGLAYGHPFVVGELACGNLKQRQDTLWHLKRLPTLEVVSHEEALSFVELQSLAGKGLGWVDLHLLSACRIHGVRLWTLDRALGRAAKELGC